MKLVWSKNDEPYRPQAPKITRNSRQSPALRHGAQRRAGGSLHPDQGSGAEPCMARIGKVKGSPWQTK